MDQLRVIEGVKEDKPDYFEIYLRMFMKAVQELKNQKETTKLVSKDVYKKAIFTGVRFINNVSNDLKDHKYVKAKFDLIVYVKELIGCLTPREFMSIFPIAKEYKGGKHGMKDYFSTMKSIDEMGIDTQIGDNVSEFLWNYHNWEDVTEFVVNSMEVVSALRKAEGKKSLAEEFFEGTGLDTYTLHSGQKGKQKLINNRTGETQEVQKPRPRYLKPVQ
ncbi:MULTISPECIES: hypothetical protein [Bacillus cereus group]|uniref:Phage protein n=1 Tax=Bacillus cereus TaxID=1396 RepID=A0A9W7QFJ6_BACCE|nr:hypothetical protein [Bacillus cereus]KAB2391053.1 hypothetical protein F8172_20295 [Bacillus cereus]KAB2406825.1 hypothetical protein F8170_12445 [Bacillus cereus]KAB2428384.1 hypothetical protein F8168_19200 [Bacillus cereus]